MTTTRARTFEAWAVATRPAWPSCSERSTFWMAWALAGSSR
ncbi:hypothetical protein [Nonomuraea sp. NPDC049684]